MGLLLTGVNSEICKELTRLAPCQVRPITRDECDMQYVGEVDALEPLLREHDKVVVAHGAVSTLPFLSRSDEDISASIAVNCLSVVRLCEIALAVNPTVAICVLGSSSAIKGSWDIPYWLAKAALHAYVKERRLAHPDQQLVCVAPSGMDCGMTLHRPEEEIAELREGNPKGRLATALEVARVVHFLLFVDEGYTTNTVIEINGGRFARRYP